MMISLEELRNKYRLNVTGVLHVGAHKAEEHEAYRDNGIESVWWVEGDANLMPLLRERVGAAPGNRIINAVVYEVDDAEIEFNIAPWENGMCSSILEFGTHKQHAPFVEYNEKRTVRTRTIDSLDQEHSISPCNFLNLDIQGAELHALKGATKFLEKVDYIFTEINFDELYKDCVRVWELDEFLSSFGFVRVETLMANGGVMWGDALYIRKPV